MAATTIKSEKQINTTGLMNLGVVYIVWSSTYLAIRLAVREGSGFPPFTMGTMRIGLSCILLFLWIYFRKQLH